MAAFINYEGRVFGRLTVVKRSGTDRFGNALWLCRCSCGKDTIVRGHFFVRLNQPVKSCGCLQRERATTHGGYASGVDIKYHLKARLLQYIKVRAQHRGYETDLEILDMPEVPDVCPVLGIPLQLRKVAGQGNGKGRGGKFSHNSPTIDRRNPNLPYLKKYKDNLHVISFRANNLKSNGTIEELEKVLAYMREIENNVKF